MFKRNSIWSKKKPIPEIGTINTNLKKVKAFYEFWDDFQTWRDFSCHDEYHPDEAEDRYEKRWMEKENDKIRKKYVKEERIRLNELVRRARKLDPRMVAEEKRVTEEAERIKRERFEKKLKVKLD